MIDSFLLVSLDYLFKLNLVRQVGRTYLVLILPSAFIADKILAVDEYVIVSKKIPINTIEQFGYIEEVPTSKVQGFYKFRKKKNIDLQPFLKILNFSAQFVNEKSILFEG